MCGFAGYIFDARRVARPSVSAMTSTLAHRGPDSTGGWLQGPAGVGAARLQIVGGAAANQPLRGEVGTTLVWNGEIYNYKQLDSSWVADSSDSLVLQRLLESEGTECLSRLRGCFALAHVSADGRSCLLARDEFGQKPLFYHLEAGRLVFGSEVRAVLAGGVTPRLDEEGLKDYLALQFYSPGRTLFDGVHSVMPGSWLRFELGQDGVRLAGSGVFQFADSASGQPTVSEVAALLDESIELQSCGGIPAGISLSGGLDSTVVASALHHHGQDSLEAFVGFPTDSKELDERDWARLAAKEARLALHEIPISGNDFARLLPEVVRTLEMPVAGPGSVAQYMIAKAAASSCRVFYGGQGGDEVFGGYERHRILLALRDGERRSRNPLYQPLMDRMSACGGGLRGYFAAIHRGPFSKERVSRTMSRFAHLMGPADSAPFERATDFEMSVQLPGLLHVDDRCTSRFGMEGRSPLLDQRLVHCVRRMDIEDRGPVGSPRSLFLNAFAPYLPDAIASRTDKMGFPLPLDRWLRSEMRTMVGDFFTSRATIERGFLDRCDARRLADMKDTSPREVFGHLMLELWFREYLRPANHDTLVHAEESR